MKLSQLEYFAAICGNSFNISRAADILHVSQPCISNAIKELESEFGVKLFSRNNKRLELTKEGEICLASVQTILNNTSQLANQMYNIINQKSIIHIGVSSMVSMARISKIITSFKQSNPKIDFDIDIGDSIGFIDSMVNGTQLMDLAIINIHKHIDYNAKNLTVIPIYQTELMLATSTSNKLAKKSFVNYFDLENEPLILNKNNGKKDSIILKRFLNMGISPNIVLYLDSVEAVKCFVKSNYGSSLLFSDMLENESDIVGIPFSESNIATVGFLYKKSHSLSSIELNFIEFIKNIL